MKTPLLSTYSGGENRITASTLAVFERIDLVLVQELLEGATESGDELTAVTFSNQVVGSGSVPDAVIRASFSWFFETKIVTGQYDHDGHARTQLIQHTKALEDNPEARLFVLTPDAVQPKWFDTLDTTVRSRVLWLSFRTLELSISQVLADNRRMVPEQTKFLLIELVALYEAEGLLSSDDTVIVAALAAWGEYLTYGAYVCQPHRAFRPGLKHFGFYRKGQIEKSIARVKGDFYPDVTIDRPTADALRLKGEVELAALVDRLLDNNVRPVGVPHGVFLLSKHDDESTVHLPAPIVNDTKAASGRNWAWTLGQRYTSLDRLRTATRTSELSV